MKTGVADYVVSGSWSKKAWKEAKIFGDARMIGNRTRTSATFPKALEVSNGARRSTYPRTKRLPRYHELPDTRASRSSPTSSSCFLSEPIDITKRSA